MTGLLLRGAPRAKFDAAHYAMSWDGNSISDPIYSDLVPQTRALAPISNQIAISNFAESGKSIQYMIAHHVTLMNAAYVNGKINHGFIFELTNNIFNDGRTGLQTCDDLVAYINALKAVHPDWRIILMTGLPRGSLFGSTWNAVTGEEQMQIANAYIRANYRAMGAVALVEARRAGGPFDFTDCTNLANFPSSLWTDPTHPNSAGKAILAQYIADVFKRLPAR